MRKIVSVLIALIMMMSAAPVFAEEVQEAEQTEPATEQAVEQQPDQPEKVTNPTAEKSSVQNEAEWVEVTLYDSEENKLEDREKVQIESSMTMKEMLDVFNRNRHYEFDWEKCTYLVNEKKEDAIDIDNFRLQAEDSVIIRAESSETSSEAIELNGEAQLAMVAPETLSEAYTSTGTAVTQTATASKWAFGNEWIVIGLSRAESLNEADAEAYCDRVAAYVASKNSDKLDEKLSTFNSKTVISLTSLGFDPTDVNGVNLLKPLADMNYLTKQGLSGPVWALIAFDSHNYEIPTADANQKQTTREGLVNLLVRSQLPGQGWDMSCTTSDVDMTCMVLQALTPYYNDDNPAVKNAVDNALDWLSSIQNSDGSFCTDLSAGVSSESQSQVIVTLTGLGIDPETDSRFVVKGSKKSAMDALMSFYFSRGGFKHVSSNVKADRLATEQGYYALTAYYRFKSGKSSLYDMSDISLEKFRGTAKPGDKGNGDKEIKTAGRPSGKTRSLGYLALDNEETDDSLIEEHFSDGQDNQSASEQQKEYNEYMRSVKLVRTLPWIYIAIGALALMGLVLVLRNRKPE